MAESIAPLIKRLKSVEAGLAALQQMTRLAPLHALKAKVITIEGGRIIATRPHIQLLAQSGSADDLVSIGNTSDGKMIILAPRQAGQTITVRDRSGVTGGNIDLGGTDIDLAAPGDNLMLYFVASTGYWQIASSMTDGGGGGATAFTDLTDAPPSYSGEGGKVVSVKGSEDGLEFTAIPSAPVTSVNTQTGAVVLDTDDIAEGATNKYFHAHASTHQNGGSDEIATATPGANAIPKADGAGKLALGWLLTGSGNGLDADLVDGQHGSYYLARANHTGTQLAATISDFDTQVRTNRLDQMTSPTADVSMNSHKLTNVSDPTSAQDAATKSYVDALINGLDLKASVRAATTANITLSGAQTIDGVSVVAGDRVLVKDQTTAANNGIYVASAGAWSRAADADSSAEVTAGMFTFVSEGTTNGDNGFALTTNDPITLGTTALTFTQVSGAGQIIAGSGLSKSGNTLDVNVDGVTIEVNADTLRRMALTGDVTASAGSAATTIAANAVSDTKLRDSGALSVIGRSLNSSGDPGDISATAASDAVLRESGSAIGFGTVATGGIAAHAITNAKLAQMAASTFKGNNTAGTADAADLTVSQMITALGLNSGGANDIWVNVAGDTMAGNLNMGTNAITNMANPSSAQDAATKTYADQLVNVLDWKASARVATTANITLSGTQTIDGVAVVAGDRVLVKDQSSAATNGIYVCAAGAWARATDADGDTEVTSGLTVFIAAGTTNGSKFFVLTTTDPITVGTTALSFVRLSTLLDHNVLLNLTTGDPHTQYALLAGRSGGQSLFLGPLTNSLGRTSPPGTNTKLYVETLNTDAIAQFWQDTADANGPIIILGKSRGTAVYSNVIVADDDVLGRIDFSGGDGVGSTTASTGATIRALVDGTPGNNDMPTRLEFMTSPDASNTPLTRMSISNAGYVSIGGVTPLAGYLFSLNADGVAAYASIVSYGTALDSSLGLYLPRGTAAAPSVNLAGDILGSIYFGGWDGNISNGARIYAQAASDWGSGGDTTDDPTDLIFATVPNGSATLSDRMTITSGGFVGIGRYPTTALEAQGQVSSFQEAASAVLQATTFRTNQTQGVIQFVSARGTEAAPTIVAVDDRLGQILAYGYSAAAANYVPAARIAFEVDGTPDSAGDTTDMPGRISFWTTPDGSSTLTERVRIEQSGSVGFGTTDIESAPASFTSFQLGSRGYALFSTTGSGQYWTDNGYYTGSVWQYRTTNAGSLYQIVNGLHIWDVVASGTIDTTLTWVEAMRITNGAALLIGITSAGAGGVLAIQAGAGANDMGVGGVLYVGSATHGNVTTGETDLDSFSVVVDTLAVNNQSLHFEGWGTFNSTGSKTLKLKWGATVITCISAVTSNGTWYVRGRIIRTGSATQDMVVEIGAPFQTPATAVQFTTAAENLASGSVVLKFTGQGGASNEVKQEGFMVFWADSNT